MLRGSLYNKVLFLVLAGAVVGFLARTQIQAAPPSLVVTRSKAEEGLWKELSFNGYGGCASLSASECVLKFYDYEGSWTTLLFNDPSWGVRNFSVYDSGWSAPNWACISPFDESTEMINVARYFDGINGLTGLYRRKFTSDLEGAVIKSATLKMLSDNKAAVYLNGEAVISNIEGCYSVDIASERFLEGVDMNVLAIQLSNDSADTTNSNNPMGLGYELTINYDEAPPPPTGTIWGRVWNDLNGNGIRDLGDFNKSGVGIEWSGPDPGSVTTTPFQPNNFNSPDLAVGPYTVTISPGASWSLTAKSCPNLSIPSCNVTVSDGGVADVEFGIWNNPLSWIQAKNADVYAGGGLSISVPNNGWFIEADSDTSGGGVAISGNSTLSANGRLSRRPNGNASAPGWGLSGYDHASINWNEFSEAGGSLIDRHTSGFVIDTSNKDSYVSGLKVVLVEHGDLTISGDVTTLSGVFVVQDGDLIIEDGPDQLLIKGMLYAKDGLTVNRTLSNNALPAVVVEYDPSYLLQNIPGLTKHKISWKEVR